MSKDPKMGSFFLNKEVSLAELNKGFEFQVDYDERYSDSEEDSYFDEDAFKTFKEDVTNMDGDQKPKLLSGANVPFTEFKERMKPVTEDGKILKEVMKNGFGIPIPDKSVVMIHYDAYLENQTQPFDSTRLRKRPFKFLFGDGNILPGLEICIQTMRKEEMSRFLVSPEYAYGTMGCPPRIPPSADILYEVEVINFYASKDAIEFEDLSIEEQKKASFEKVVSVYQVENKMANDLFHSKMYKQAIARYRKTANMLQDVSVANEEEDDKRNGYLLKVYLNLAQGYINIQNPQKAIIYSDLALRIDENNPKALYRMGISLFLSDEYERAENYLQKAKQLRPEDKSINLAIKKLEFKRKQHLDWEKLFCKKMFSSEEESEKKRELPESPEFLKAIEEQLESFVETEETEWPFSSGYTEDQVEVVKELARKFDLHFVTKIMCGVKINKLIKKV